MTLHTEVVQSIVTSIRKPRTASHVPQATYRKPSTASHVPIIVACNEPPIASAQAIAQGKCDKIRFP